MMMILVVGELCISMKIFPTKSHFLSMSKHWFHLHPPPHPHLHPDEQYRLRPDEQHHLHPNEQHQAFHQ
jgi:hypothetical protein